LLTAALLCFQLQIQFCCLCIQTRIEYQLEI
jgi:hypothetical protein